MANQRQLFCEALTITGMVVLSFGAGWWTAESGFASSRHINFDFSKPFRCEPTLNRVFLRQTPDTGKFLVGDRVDVLVQDDDSIKPLILDAIVTDQGTNTSVILAPAGSRDLVAYASGNGLRIIFRNSVAPTAPIWLEYKPR